MESPEDIERALARLMPAAFSEEGKRSLDELIDGLAAGETPAVTARKPAWAWVAGVGAAAAAAVFAMNFPAPDRAVPAAAASMRNCARTSKRSKGFCATPSSAASTIRWSNPATGACTPICACCASIAC